MERATQKLEQSTTLLTSSDARGLSTRRVTRPDRMAVSDKVQEDQPARGLTSPRTGLGSFGSPSGLGSKPFGG